MIVYGVALPDSDGEITYICTINYAATFIQNLKDSFKTPENARDVTWNEQIQTDGSFSVTWKANTGRLLNMNGPLSGPREEALHGRTWDFIPYEVLGA